MPFKLHQHSTILLLRMLTPELEKVVEFTWAVMFRAVCWRATSAPSTSPNQPEQQLVISLSPLLWNSSWQETLTTEWPPSVELSRAISPPESSPSYTLWCVSPPCSYRLNAFKDTKLIAWNPLSGREGLEVKSKHFPWWMHAQNLINMTVTLIAGCPHPAYNCGHPWPTPGKTPNG